MACCTSSRSITAQCRLERDFLNFCFPACTSGGTVFVGSAVCTGVALAGSRIFAGTMMGVERGGKGHLLQSFSERKTETYELADLPHG
jgi:hypothetical protein